MLNSYFFIPGDKQKYIDKISTTEADFIVIDLEDAVSAENKQLAFNLVTSIQNKLNYYIRIPFEDNSYTSDQIAKLITYFQGRIVVPKLNNVATITKIKELVPNLKLAMIILIETPQGYINFADILKNFAKDIKGIGFGTHDFCSLMGIKHTFDNLVQYKREVVLYAKAYGIEYIDGVDLDLANLDNFKSEALFAFNIGAGGKFLIHPKQLQALNAIEFLTSEEIEEVKKVYNYIQNIPDNQIAVYVIDGKVYEKPHILRIKFLMEKINKQTKTK